jgi:hypothetical protein
MWPRPPEGYFDISHILGFMRVIPRHVFPSLRFTFGMIS